MHRHVLSVLRRSPVLAVLAGVLVLASAGFAVASALPGTGSTIHACIQKNGGALRVVGSARDCKKSERAISFAKEGPRGLRGQTGAQGPAGAEGKDGAQGPQGPGGQDAPKAAGRDRDGDADAYHRRATGLRHPRPRLQGQQHVHHDRAHAVVHVRL